MADETVTPKEKQEKEEDKVIENQLKTAKIKEEASAEPAEEKVAQEGEPEEEIEEEIEEEMTTLHERVIATLSYMGPLAIIPFYLKKDSKFCRFHGKQGLLLAVILFLSMSIWIIDFIMDLFLLAQTVVFVYMGVMGSLAGKWKKFPWVYEKACLFEKTLSLKTKEEEEEDEDPLKPDQVSNEVKEEVSEPPAPSGETKEEVKK